MERGKFIVFEGGEGTGKSTQIGLLKERAAQAFPGRAFVFTREPGGSPYAERIRELIFSDDGSEASGRTLLGLFMAARADHIEKVVEPALAVGKVVVCDRYLTATYAYQIVGQEDAKLEEVFWAYAALMPRPDLTLLFDLDPLVAAERVGARVGERNHFDTRPNAFHERIRNGFKEYFKKAGGTLLTIDASHSVEEVWKDVEAAVSSIL